MVQYRNKSADAHLRQEQGAALLAICRAASVPLIINDDLDLAAALEADGLHLAATTCPSPPRGNAWQGQPVGRPATTGSISR